MEGRKALQLFARQERTRGVLYPQNNKKNANNMTYVLLRTWRPFFGGTWDPSTVTVAVLFPGPTRRPRNRHLSQCS